MGMAVNRPKSTSLYTGLLLVGLGVILLLNNLVPDFDLYHIVLRYWPTLLIALGVAKLMQYSRLKRRGPQS